MSPANCNCQLPTLKSGAWIALLAKRAKRPWGELNKESHHLALRGAVFFLVRKLKRARLASNEKSHQLPLMAFFVAGTGLEPATFGL